MEPPFKSLAVANRFVEMANESGEPITLMKLLKLIYFANGWHLALANRKSLISDRIEAWKFGPVAPTVYHSFKEYGSGPITDLAEDVDRAALAERGELKFHKPILKGGEFIDAFMARVWEIYGKLTAFQLSELTHQPGTPWHKVWFELGGSQRKGTDIPDDLIAEYFKGKLAQANG